MYKYIIILPLKNERDKYHFEIWAKELPPRIDSNKLTNDEIVTLLKDARYMLSHDDTMKVNLTLSQMYKVLKKSNPGKEQFSFSSLAYGVDKITK